MKRYRHVTGPGVSLHVSAADDATAARDALFYAFGRPLEGRRLPSLLTVDGAPFDVLWPATGPVVVPATRLPYAVINTRPGRDGGRAGPGGSTMRKDISHEQALVNSDRAETGRTCRKCLMHKPADRFRRVPSNRKFGLFSRCKDCENKRLAEYAASHPERVRASKRESARRAWLRGKRPSSEVREKARANYLSKPETKAKIAARSTLAYAIRKGDMARLPCARCGAGKADAHHDDYSKPLSVTWLCKPCHGQEHRHD